MIGQKLGSYLIEKELGAGAMGVVYKGVHVDKGWEVAVKILHPEVIARGGNAVERFVREIELLETFRHPNIVRYLAKGKLKGIHYYVMAFMPGATLDQIIRQEGPLDWVRTVKYAIQICAALEYAHSKQVIHRDLKPSNLMVDKNGDLRLTDFGIAKPLDQTALTAPGRTLGTAAYMALEQITGTPEISHKTDLYALGVVMYEMLTKQTPFKGPTIPLLLNQHLEYRPYEDEKRRIVKHAPKPSKLGYYIPKALDDLIESLLMGDPVDRPYDAQLVRTDLEKLLERHKAGEKLKMVGNVPDKGVDVSYMDATLAGTKASKAKTKTKAAKKIKAGRPGGEIQGEDFEVDEGRTPIALLVLALVVIGALIGYFLWPPSEGYLYAQAEKLMASDQRTDWMIAKDQYLDPLDQRFPNHVRKPQTDAWRDKLGLAHAANRAELLRTAKDEVEQVFLDTQKAVKDALERSDDREAAKLWRGMEKTLSAKPHPERGWGLLAGKRAEEVEKEMAERRKEFVQIAERADALDSRNLPDQAALMRREALTRYGKWSDLAELVAAVQAKLPAGSP